MKITRDQFLAERSPRRGNANPERMDVPLWLHLVETEESAYSINEEFDGPDVFEAGPGWCFDRMGCSTTELPDGRVLRIAGEHEDSYDPDFYIYNDVIVKHPDGRVEIHGYAPAAFPATDFHSATLVGGRVLLIGNLGYPDERRPGTTQVCALDVETLAVTRIETSGEGPGWIHHHDAELNEAGNALIVTGGDVDDGEDILENHDDWSLCLETWTWTRLTQRAFEQWRVEREDRDDLYLFDMNCLQFENDTGFDSGSIDEELKKQFEEAGVDPEDIDLEMDSAKKLEDEGRTYDAETYASLYVPPLPHEKLPESWELLDPEDLDEDPDVDDVLEPGGQRAFDDARVSIDGVTVRYRDDSTGVQIKIEGELPTETVSLLCEDLRAKLAKLQNSECVCNLELRLPKKG